MTDGATMTIVGMDEALRELRSFVPKMREGVLKGMCATGASVLRQEAVRRAPDLAVTEAAYSGLGLKFSLGKGHPPPGTLKRSIYQTRWVAKCTDTQEVWFVDVRKGKQFRSVGKGATNKDAYYAHWVEFGHFARVPKEMTKTAKAAGRALGVATFVAPHPFMRPAFAAKRAEAQSAMHDYLMKRLPLMTAANHYLKAA